MKRCSQTTKHRNPQHPLRGRVVVPQHGGAGGAEKFSARRRISNSDIASIPNITPLPFSLILISWPRAFGLMAHMAPRTFAINPGTLAIPVLPSKILPQRVAESV